jgi:NAD(P)-dependent dehydrogenase (short-subunit alcohol dehydrogenase family)
MKNLFDLRGERILVTGAGGSIGGATAARLRGNWAPSCYRRPEGPRRTGRRTQGQCRGAGQHKRDDVNALVKDIGHIDALIDTSGYYVKGDWARRRRRLGRTVRPHDGHQREGPDEPGARGAAADAKRGSGRIVLTSSMSARNAGSTLASNRPTRPPKAPVGAGALLRAPGCGRRRVVNGVSPGPILTPLLVSAKQPFHVDQLPDEAFWPARRDRLAGGLPGFARRQLHDRRGARRQRRHVLLLRRGDERS